MSVIQYVTNVNCVFATKCKLEMMEFLKKRINKKQKDSNRNHSKCDFIQSDISFSE